MTQTPGQDAIDAPPGPLGIVVAWLNLLVFETCAQIALKEGGSQLSQHSFGAEWLVEAAHNPWVWAGIIGYLGSFCAWMIILNTVPLSAGFPLTAVVMLVVICASWFIFEEAITLWRMIGIVLIVAGVTVIGRGDA